MQNELQALQESEWNVHLNLAVQFALPITHGTGPREQSGGNVFAAGRKESSVNLRFSMEMPS